MDAITQAIQQLIERKKQQYVQGLKQLDPANQQTPILGAVRKFNAQTFGTPTYANPQVAPDQRIADAVTQYASTFMGGHGNTPGVGKNVNQQMAEALGKGDFDNFNKLLTSESKYAKYLPEDQPAILREGQDPLGHRSDYSDLVARERFNIPSLKKIGAGSDRDVYDLGNGQVLKIAKQARGLAQNSSEGDMYAPVPEVFESGKNYVVAEKVGKPDAKTRELVKILGKSRAYGGNTDTTDTINNAANVYFQRGDDDMANLIQDFNNYDPMIGDLMRIKNWGSKNGEPILLDGGALSTRTLDDYKGKTNMADPDFRQAVMQSRQAKKKFGDMDKNTMYGIAAMIASMGLLNKKKDKKTGTM